MRRAIGYLIIRKRLLLILGAVLVLAAYVVFAPSPFQKAFDDSLSHYPLAASIARRDAHLRDIFLRQTEQAFNKGGWRAANGALRISLASEVEIYADDEHINAISRAGLMLLQKLENNPAACKAYLFFGAEKNEYPEAATELAKLDLAHRAAIENGFDRRVSGIIWTRPSDDEVLNIERQLERGPVAKLSDAEVSNGAKYLDGDAELACSASVKKMRNLLAMDDRDAADAERIRLTNTGKIDVAHVLDRLCREEKRDPACP